MTVVAIVVVAVVLDVQNVCAQRADRITYAAGLMERAKKLQFQLHAC